MRILVNCLINVKIQEQRLRYIINYEGNSVEVKFFEGRVAAERY